MSMSNKWVPLTGADIADLKAQQFTANEVCLMARISPERLHEWHRLGLVPEPRTEAARGFRRKYRFYELAFLMSLRILASRGVRLRTAADLCETVLVPQIDDIFNSACAAKSISAAEISDLTLLAVYNLAEQEGHETYAYKVFWDGRLVEDDGTEHGDIRSWMARDSITNAILVQPVELALDLRFQMEDVLRSRGADHFREAIRDHIALFRRPKRKAAVRQNSGAK